MGRLIRVVTAVAAGLGLIHSVAVFATELSPHWSSQDGVASNPNMSFLSNTVHEDVWNPLAGIVDAKKAAQMRQATEDRNRDYDLRCTYGLNDPFAQYFHQNAMNDFGNDLFKQVVDYHAAKNQDKVKEAGERDPGFKPAAIIGVGAAAFWVGKPVAVNLDDDTKLQTRTSIRRQMSAMELSSPLVNAGVSADFSKPSTVDPTLPPVVDPTQQNERYRFSVSRGLSVMDLSSRFSYGSTSDTVSASLSRPLARNLTAEVTSVRPSPTNRNNNPGEEVLKFTYGLNF